MLLARCVLLFSVINPFPFLYSLLVSINVKHHSLFHPHASVASAYGPSTRARLPCVRTELTVARYVRARSYAPLRYSLIFHLVSCVTTLVTFRESSALLCPDALACSRVLTVSTCCSRVIGRSFVGTSESPLVFAAYSGFICLRHNSHCFCCSHEQVHPRFADFGCWRFPTCRRQSSVHFVAIQQPLVSYLFPTTV